MEDNQIDYYDRPDVKELRNFEAEGLSHQDRAWRVCAAMDHEYRLCGANHLGTWHYDVGIPLIVQMIKAVIAEERNNNNG